MQWIDVIILLLVPVTLVLVFWSWKLVEWVWVKPRRFEKFLRKQGMKGSHYRLLYGDSKDTIRMYKEARSKPIGLHDDILPRIMPNILLTIQKYGDFSFTWVGPRPRIFILDPAIARVTLNQYRVYSKTFKVSNERTKMVASGLAFLEGDEWSHSRSKLNPIFHTDKLKHMSATIQSCCDITLNEWRELVMSNGGSHEIDVFASLEIFTSTILAQLMFSSPYTEEIKRTFLQLAELAILSGLHSDIAIPGEKYFPTKTNRKANAMHNKIRATLTSMIYRRLEKRKAERYVNRDLLDAFMEELYEGNITSEKECKRIIEGLIGQCKIFFFAGFETSSNLLTWCLIQLSINRDCQDRAREEVLRILGDKKEITSDDVAKLKYITMVLNETLRLYSPIMELSRYVEEDTKVKNYTLPKGSIVSFPILMFHQSTEMWGEDALKFKPERFADGVAKAAQGDVPLMPFGWGPRICIGINFSMLESKILLAMILRDFSFELSPTYTHAPTVAFTLHPQFGAPLILTKL